MDFASLERYLAIGLLVTSMIGMGATLRPQEFQAVFRSPRGVFAVLMAQVLATPLVAVALSMLLDLSAGVAFGLLLIAALPGGSLSNLLTFLGRGNVPLSIVATTASTLLCMVSTALLLRLYGGTTLPADFAMPVGQIMIEISCYLLAPLAVGMLIRRIWRKQARRISQVFIQLSTLLLIVFIVGALSSGRLQIMKYGWRTPCALILFGIASMWLGVFFGWLMRLRGDDRFTVAIEVLVRNGNLGLLLKAILFPAVAGVADPLGDGVLFVVLFYSGLSLLLGGLEIILKRLQVGVLYAPPKPSKETA